MIENKQQFQEYENKLVTLFEAYKLQLDQDSIDFVQRNIKAAELEMAYEGFVRSLNEESVTLLAQDSDILISMGFAFDLHINSYFPYFWEINYPWLSSFSKNL